MKEIWQDTEYKTWLINLKSKIHSAQIKAALVVNSALIEFYWELGQSISEQITQSNWGDKILEQVSKDLQSTFPEMKGLSRSNLAYTKQFYEFYQASIVQQPVGQLQMLPFKQVPWGHNIIIFSKSQSINEAIFYLQQTLENNWSRDTLALQVKSKLFERQGKSINNFQQTLPLPQSDLAEQTLKDPYVFDFLTMTKPYHEKDIGSARNLPFGTSINQWVSASFN